MQTIISFRNKKIPVYYTSTDRKKKTDVSYLLRLLDNKVENGKRAVKACIESLISIEIIGCEAILHTRREEDTLALSLY
ncbi:3-dehydroquinate dehydratase [Paenibacillus sp. MBLB4367]|uniref:3-dehydroquinate dehydratase n=1 Tax=Paenibacillus sp. MBLB4367 TaxID=3384767 RepID=UPI0039082934